MKTIDLKPHMTVIHASGPDARAFLHAQLTCNLDQRPPEEGCLGACLTAKGKVVGSFLVLPQGDDLMLVGRTDNAENVVGHLAKFVLRARVSLDVSANLPVAGRILDSGDPPPGVPGSLASIRRQDDGGWQLPDGRVLMIGAAGEQTESGRWKMYDMRQGLVLTTAGQSDRFIPQMLNLDGAGGVSFRKGCYPGQEIVARARNLGRVKRGLAWLRSPASMQEGDPIQDEAQASVGEVIEVLATSPGCEALAVVRRDAGEAARVGGQTVRLRHFSSAAESQRAQGSATI